MWFFLNNLFDVRSVWPPGSFTLSNLAAIQKSLDTPVLPLPSDIPDWVPSSPSLSTAHSSTRNAIKNSTILRQFTSIMQQQNKWPPLPVDVTVANLDKQSHLAQCQPAKQWESVTDSLSEATDNFWRRTKIHHRRTVACYRERSPWFHIYQRRHWSTNVSGCFCHLTLASVDSK